MGLNTYDIGDIVDPHYFSTKMKYESTTGGFWCKFYRERWVGYSGKEGVSAVGKLDKAKFTFSGAPIETIQELESGGTNVDIPMKMRYVGNPRSGNSQLQGTGEGARFLFEKKEIWNTKKAFDIVTEVTPTWQILRQNMANELKNRVRQGAAEWLRDWTEGCVPFALHYGASPELCKDISGLVDARNTFSPFSHPNTFVAALGRVPHGNDSDTRPGGQGFEDNIEGYINTMWTRADTATAMSPQLLVWFRMQASRLNIRPVMFAGQPYWFVVMKDSAYAQLDNNDRFRNDLIGSLPRNIKDNPLFSDVVAVYGQMIIYVNTTQWGVQMDGSGKVMRHTSGIGPIKYGPANGWMGAGHGDAFAYDTNDATCTWIIDAGALARIKGKVPEKYSVEVWDHGQKSELGCFWWQSYQRPDYIDERNVLGNGEQVFAYNDSAACLITKSPHVGILDQGLA